MSTSSSGVGAAAGKPGGAQAHGSARRQSKLNRNPEAMTPEPMPGHVWLETPGKVLHVVEWVLEFTDELPSG
jgi:hypothetical protein